MLDNVVAFDLRMRLLTTLPWCAPFVWLFDFANAYPSLAFAFIFLVFKAIGIPKYFRKALFKLFVDVRLLVMYRGRCRDAGVSLRGTLQGMPPTARCGSSPRHTHSPITARRLKEEATATAAPATAKREIGTTTAWPNTEAHPRAPTNGDSRPAPASGMPKDGTAHPPTHKGTSTKEVDAGHLAPTPHVHTTLTHGV